MEARVVAAVLLLALISCAEGAKILGVLPTHAKSHQNIGGAYLKALADAGHEVTVISPFPLKNAPKNYRDIELTGMVEKMTEGLEQNFFNFKGSGGFITPFFMLFMLYNEFSTKISRIKITIQKPLNLLLQ